MINKYGRHYPICNICGNEKRPEDVLDFNIPNCLCDRTKEKENNNKAIRDYFNIPNCLCDRTKEKENNIKTIKD